MPIRDETWLTTAELAELTGKPVGTINRWAKEGKLRGEKLPGRTGSRIYRRSDVEHLLPVESVAS